VAQDIQAKLNLAIEAARRGDRQTARKLLQEIVLVDNTHEQAWLWLASVSDSLEDKRKCLRRVLQINPNNTTARDGLAQIQARLAGTAPATTDAANQTGPREINWVSLGITVATVFAVGLLGFTVLRIVQNTLFVQDTDLSPFEVAQRMTETAQVLPTESPIPTTGPTVTPPIVIVTLNAATLPPTFTPTFTPTATDTPTPAPTQPPLSTYRLLFLRSDGADTVLGRINADGGVIVEQAIPSETYAVSPNGETVVFVGPAQGAPVPPPPTLDPDATSAPDPTPTDIPPTPVIDGVAIYAAPVDNLEAATPLTPLSFTTADITALAFSADGERLAFIADRGTRLLVLDVATGEIETLLGEDGGFKSGVSWSPDGTRLVFTSDISSPGFGQIFEYQLENGQVTQFTESVGSSLSPVYSPDGSSIAFVSDRGGDGDIYVMEANGSAARLLTASDEGAEDRAPAWSADGRWIAFASNRETPSFQIYLVNLAGEVRQVTADSQTNEQPTFLPTTP
jgi:hypothetical protein